MATRRVQLETTSPAELIELMKQHVELLVMQDGIPLARVSPLATDHRARVKAALGDLLVQYPDQPDDDLDESALMQEIRDGTRGVTFSDIIIEERR